MESQPKKRSAEIRAREAGSTTEDISKKTKNQKSSFSDIETGDALFDSLKLDQKEIRINEELTYCGKTINGKKEGKGLIKNSSGFVIYDGSFKDDLYEGLGTLFFDNGFFYNGQFERGKRNGKGTFASKIDKYKYDGEWVDDIKEGIGHEFYPDGSSYKGEFSNNKKNGKGLYYMNDGSIYDGDFYDDKINGKGKFTWSDNKFYDGEWKNNSIDGFGIFIRNEKVYIGNNFF
jgi:hypothetical protein